MTDKNTQAVEAAVERLKDLAMDWLLPTSPDKESAREAFDRELRAALTSQQEVAAEVGLWAERDAEGNFKQNTCLSHKPHFGTYEPLYAASRSPAAAGVAGGVDASRDEVMRHDFPALQQFHSKHAMGPLAAPSCLCCGKSTQGVEIGVRHLELPGIVICEPCKTAAQAQPSPHPAVGGSGGVLVGEELALFRATLEGFADCGESDTDYSTLVDWARRGFLECTNFQPTAAAHRMLASGTPTGQKGNAA